MEVELLFYVFVCNDLNFYYLVWYEEWISRNGKKKILFIIVVVVCWVEIKIGWESWKRLKDLRIVWKSLIIFILENG